MKRDVQVGVVLGVIILAIIGVFLSTRTAVKEPNIPIPEIEASRVGTLNMNELPLEPPASAPSQDFFKETTTAVQNMKQKGTGVTNTAKIQEQLAEIEENVIEGEWKKAKETESIDSVAHEKKTSPPMGEEDWKGVHSGDIETPASNLRIHKVQYSDDLYKIAKKYYGDASKWTLIFNANQNKIHDRNSLRVGTELIIPEEKSVLQKSKTETTTSSTSQGIKKEDTKSGAKEHTVQQGDSLYKLAVKYYNDGTKWNKIFDANKKLLENQKSLKIGQSLIIPDL